MLAASIPNKFPIPWANGATSPFVRSIPTPSQITIQNGAASLTDGFPPLCFQPLSSGGAAPFGEDFNGIIQQLTAWNQWQAAGGPVFYDAAFSLAIGGYPKGAILSNATVTGAYWVSQVDNNTSDPDTGGTNWLTFYQGNRYAWNSSSPPASDVPLAVGDKVTITFTSVTSVPLKIACATGGGIYRVLWIVTASNSINTDLAWGPNNLFTGNGLFSSYGTMMSDEVITGPGSATANTPYTQITVSPYIANIPVNNAGYKSSGYFYFDLFFGPVGTDNINDIGPFMFDAIAQTFTAGKLVKAIGAVRGGPVHSFVLWEDTTTVWSSLGTLQIAGGTPTLSGSVFIERLA